MKKIILITGWTGYIGSHWVVAFEEAGYQTVIVDNLSNSNIDTLDWIEKIIWNRPDFYELDLRDKKALEKIFKKYDFDWVVHFAWMKAVWESCEKPLEYFDNNIVWSIYLLELMDKYNVKNIISSSSATVYDMTSKHAPILWKGKWELDGLSEINHTWTTVNPYGTTKFLFERILIDLWKFSWFRIANLRYFNPIWAHKSGYIWENPEWNPDNLLPFILKVANWELDELKVFWNDYDTLDGTWVRDYIDVVDLINGHVLAYEKLLVLSGFNSVLQDIDSQTEWTGHAWFFESYNLWAWKGMSVLEMIKTVEKVTWKEVNFQYDSRRQWDIANVYCNPSKAEKDLGWVAKTSVKDSVKNSWKFVSKK